ncbi:MAG: ATP-binding protein, partial [Tangfeifania sp.]
TNLFQTEVNSCLMCDAAMTLFAFLAITCVIKNRLNCALNTLFAVPILIYAYYISDFYDHAPLTETMYQSLWWLLGGTLFLFYFSESDSKLFLFLILSVFTLSFHLLKANLLLGPFYPPEQIIAHPVVMYLLIFSGLFLIRNKYRKINEKITDKLQTTRQGVSKVIQNTGFSVAEIRAERDEEGNIENLWIDKVNNAFEAAFKINLHEVKNQEANYIFDLIFYNDHFDLNKFLLFNNNKTHEFHSKKLDSWYKIHVLKPTYNKFFIIFEDITKAKEKIADLESSRRRYKVLLEAIPDMFFVIGKDGTYEDFVIKESDLFKVEDANIVGSTIYDVGFPKNMAQKIYSCIQNSLKNNTLETIEYSLNTPNGTYLYEMRLAKLNATSVISVARDITRRKNAEFNLEKARKKAEESDRLKSAFLANLSHEIRTPLNIITNFTRMLTDSNLGNTERIELSDAISQNGTQLLNMIDNTIHLSKIETDSVDMHTSFCKVNTLLRDIYNRSRTLVPDARPVKMHLDLDVPNPAFGFVTDTNLLGETLLILVDNAVKYTRKGEIHLGYEMLRNETVKFSVSDTGIGIPQEEIEYIFSRFYRVKNEINDITSGSGVGLPIAQHYVQLLGGELNIETAPGKGTTFWFNLPFNEGEGYLKIVS